VARQITSFGVRILLIKSSLLFLSRLLRKKVHVMGYQHRTFLVY